MHCVRTGVLGVVVAKLPAGSVCGASRAKTWWSPMAI